MDYSAIGESGLAGAGLKLVLLEYTYSPYSPDFKSPKRRVYSDGIDKDTFYYQAWGAKTLQKCDFATLVPLIPFTGTSYAGFYYQYGVKDGTGASKFKALIDGWNGTDPIQPYEIAIPSCGN